MNQEYILFSKKGKEAKIIYNSSIEIVVSSFEIIIYVSGKIDFLFDIKKQNCQKIDSVQKIEFKGITDDGFTFERDITTEFNENPVHFKFFDSMSKSIQILNPIHLKKESSKDGKILRQHFTNFLFDYNSVGTNGFMVKVKNQEFVFKNSIQYKEMKEILQKTNVPKITGHVESKFSNNYSDIKNISKNILELVSYSQRQFVQIVFDEILDDKKEVVEIILFPEVLRPARTGFNIVESSLVYEPDQSIMKFIEDCYENYQNWKEKIKLDYSLTYYLLSFIPKQGEIEYILVFTALEALLRHYEDYFIAQKQFNLEEIKKQQFKEKIDSKLTIDDAQKEILFNPENRFFYGNLSFDESLNIIYQGKITSEFKDESFGFKLTRDAFDSEAPKIRNNLMHKGEFQDYSNLSQISSNLKNVVYMFDKIFLTILGYKGYFRNYRDIERWIKLENGA